MILDKEKLVLFSDNPLSTIYYYYVNKEESERIVVFYLIKNTQSVSIYLYVEGEEGVFKEKTFYCNNPSGFDEATNYFEQLVLEETQPQNENLTNQNEQPPVGILVAYPNNSIKVLMQDGRKGDFLAPEYFISSNNFGFLVNKIIFQ